MSSLNSVNSEHRPDFISEGVQKQQPAEGSRTNRVLSVAMSVLLVVIPFAVVVVTMDYLSARLVYQLLTEAPLSMPIKVAVGATMTGLIALFNSISLLAFKMFREAGWNVC
jgi:hypothetical protein